MTLQDSFCDNKPNIDYPCEWEYKIILDKSINADEFIKKLINASFKLSVSKHTDKYTSYNLILNVEDEKMRLDIFALLKQNCKYVL